MKPVGISVLTICGIDELPQHGPRAVTHVLSLLDPNWPELTGFQAYGQHSRTTLRFHDVIDPGPGAEQDHAREHVDDERAARNDLATDARAAPAQRTTPAIDAASTRPIAKPHFPRPIASHSV